jgi:hypothetical protein
MNLEDSWQQNHFKNFAISRIQRLGDFIVMVFLHNGAFGRGERVV